MNGNTPTGNARKWALVAVSVFALDRAIVSIINVTKKNMSHAFRISLITFAGVCFNWILPIVIVYLIERRGAKSLGLQVRGERYFLYFVMSFVFLVLPAFFVPIDLSLLIEFLEQVTYIGLAEEFFFRGYLMSRFCEWLGKYKGLMLNGLVFGLTHVIFLLSSHGLSYILEDLTIGFQTFLGGLLLGYLYLKFGDIFPSSMLHISMNMYLPRIGL